jgi:hypothetical protein
MKAGAFARIVSPSMAMMLGTGAVSHATTITLGGGVDGRTFLTATSIFPDVPLTPLRPEIATLEVGRMSGGSFVHFAPADLTPVSFGSSGNLLGKWQGNASDTSAGANAFNGQQIWFRVRGDLFSALLTGGQIFPTNGGGIGDSLTIDSRSLTTIDSSSLIGPSFIDEQGNRILLGVPEPSAVMLGIIGGALVLRRR